MNKDKRLYLKNILSKSILKKEFSHKINGRWENQYIDLDLIPEIKPVFLMACKFGKSIIDKSLVIPHKQLGFPIMNFGLIYPILEIILVGMIIKRMRKFPVYFI